MAHCDAAGRGTGAERVQEDPRSAADHGMAAVEVDDHDVVVLRTHASEVLGSVVAGGRDVEAAQARAPHLVVVRRRPVLDPPLVVVDARVGERRSGVGRDAERGGQRVDPGRRLARALHPTGSGHEAAVAEPCGPGGHQAPTAAAADVEPRDTGGAAPRRRGHHDHLSHVGGDLPGEPACARHRRRHRDARDGCRRDRAWHRSCRCGGRRDRGSRCHGSRERGDRGRQSCAEPRRCAHVRDARTRTWQPGSGAPPSRRLSGAYERALRGPVVVPRARPTRR